MKFFDILQSLGGFAGIAAVLAVVPQLASIKKEVTNNHGSSMKDSVDRLEDFADRQETTQKIMLAEQKHQREMLKSLAHQLGEHIDTAQSQVAMLNSSLDDVRRRTQ